MPVADTVPPSSPIPEPLLALAPTRLPNYRHMRYLGDDLCVELQRLAARDQVLLRTLYGALSELLYAIADTATDDAQKWQAIKRWNERQDLDKFIDLVREIGLASHAQDTNEKLAKAMHDVRGGALSSLLGRLQLLDHLPRTSANLNVLFVQTRDHLKIMRSAVVGLDEPRREADKRPKAHDMRLLVDKWHESVVGPRWRERPTQMFIDCRYEGPVAECCIESAALDRIFYNLANNACRHAADGRMEMAIFPVPEPPASECLRFVLSNRVSEAEGEHLRALARSEDAVGIHARVGQNLDGLFEPEVSPTGSGCGLTVVADFVANAFGVPSRVEALRERYFGAILVGQTFRTWFHWPMARAHMPQTMHNDYHQPKQSLDEP